MNGKAHSPQLWDSVAAQYDDMRPDQSLADPQIRQRWQQLFADELPPGACTILDAGCGTGSLGLALAEAGHSVTGIDFSTEMVALARAKAIKFGLDATFDVQDAATPDFPPQSFDAIACRQVLWALPDKHAALKNWTTLLKPRGRMIFIEGLFASGNGMAESAILDALPDTMTHLQTRDLSTDQALWGGPLNDQRYLLIAERHVPA